jgi:hypothetical protein
MCGIGSDARGFLYNEGAVVSETLVPFGQARSFQGECDRSGGVSETTNGDADSVVMNPNASSGRSLASRFRYLLLKPMAIRFNMAKRY